MSAGGKERRGGRARRAALWAAAGLTGLALWPVWGARFLPMQDYPQHLFLAQVAATFDAPTYDWREHYELRSTVGPYALYYLAMRPLIPLVGPETSGKVWVSIYLLLLGGYAVHEVRARARRGQPTPWAALLLLPLAFHQMYFMGFQNYLMSIPLCLFALRAHGALGELDGPAWRRWTPMVGWGGALALVHPYTVLVFIVLGAAGAARFGWLRLGPKRALWRMAAPPALLLVLFTGWYLGQGSLLPEHARGQSVWTVRWWDLKDSAQYFALMFSGMRITQGVSALHVGLWSAIAALLGAAGLLRLPRRRRPPVEAVYCGLCLAGVAVLPFWLGHFSYFDLRLSPFCYMFGALALAGLPLALWQGAALVGLAATLLVLEVPQHQLVSEEVAQVLPLVRRMEPNARVLPVYGASASPHLDVKYFYQLHAHEHYYYHLLRGGGANPALFPSTLIPLRLRADADLPSPRTGADVPRLAPRYRYVMLRGFPPWQSFGLDDRVALRSGPWTLIDMRAAR